MQTFLLTILLALGLAGSPGVAQVATLEPYGGFVLRYGGIPVLKGDSLLLMDARWKVVDRVTGVSPRLSRHDDTMQATCKTALTTLTKTVTNYPDRVEARWEFQIKPDPRGRSVELCIGIDSAVLADFKPTGKTHGVLHGRDKLHLSSFLGEFDLDLRGSTSPWNLDDLRTVEWSKAFRLRFAPAYDPKAGCKAVARLQIKASPTRSPAFVSVSLAPAADRGLTDEVAEDGRGGWTDQGANDLHVFTPGRHVFLGIPVTVDDKVVVLKGKERPAFPAEAAPVVLDRRVARLYFLQTAAWTAQWREPIAEYELTYADGQRATIPVRYGVDVTDWWGALEPLEARLVWRGDNGQSEVGLYLSRWVNPRPQIPLRSLRMRSTGSGATPILLGLTAVAPDKLTTEQVALLDAAFAARADQPVSTADWFPAPLAWTDTVTPGTALDVSFLNEPPAGRFGFLRVRNGHLVFARGDGRPVRFWGTNAALYGPFPPKEEAPGIARCLARQGVNLVRMHLYAVYKDTMIAPDGSLNAEALDKFDYFVGQLKHVGIYTYLDLNDGMFYDRLLGKNLPGRPATLKMASLFDPDLIAAQKKLARELFTHKNPYTNLRLCDDPAVALYEITNENSLTSPWGRLKARLPEPYYTELEKRWQAWLRRQGKPPAPLGANLAASGELSRRFGAELQKQYLDEMYDFLRSLGVQAPICGTNITFTLGDLWASRRMDFTNDHGYWDHPNVHARPMTFNNRVAVRAAVSSLPMIPSFARAKVHGKPVVAGEWNYCFPNDYRCEGLPTLTAYASYQDWDGLLFYCATGSFDAGKWSRFHNRPGILVHSQQTDPATWGLSPVCALLFRRGDVSVGRRVVTLSYSQQRVWENRSVLRQMPFLPALARVETTLGSPSPDDWFISQPPTRRADELFPEARAQLHNPASSATLVVTDTGQIKRDAAAGILTVDTPRAQIATGFLAAKDELNLGSVTFRCETRFATIAVVSLDGRPVSRARRALLVTVANARNADTRIEHHRLFDMGKGPVLAEPVVTTVTLTAGPPVTVFALDTLTGRRKQTVAERVSTVRLDGTYRTFYYELTR